MKHSAIIETLKTVKEKIPNNPSTEQLFEVFDGLLYRAVSGIMQCSGYIEHTLISVAAWYSTSQRRKITQLSKDQFIGFAITVNLMDSPSSRVEFYRQASIERNLTIRIIQDWLNLAKQLVACEIAYEKNETDEHKLHHLRDALKITDSSVFYCCYNSVKYFTDAAIEFCNAIAEKYMRLVVNESVAYQQMQIRNSGSRQEIDDIAHNFMLAVYRAIYKCDPTKGTLTSYVMRWIDNAKSSALYRDEVGTAYSLPSGQRKSVVDARADPNYTLDVSDEVIKNVPDSDDTDPLNILNKRSMSRQIALLAKWADRKGYGRLALGITEVLTEKDLAMLKNASRK